jgi:hypothetical protein
MTDFTGLANPNDLVVFIPSFDRPMQLDATLKSFYRHCNNPYNYEIRVIYRVSNERFQSAYESLKSDYKNVIFIKENAFKMHLMQSIVDKTYILFVTDDCIFTHKFDLEVAKNLLSTDPEAIGFSLRLGKNTRVCYPIGKLNQLPDEINFDIIKDENINIIDWTKIKIGDFGYPLEVSSSLYEISIIKDLINNYDYNNPNDLEWIMACNLIYKRELCDLFFYDISVAFCDPINKVQKVNNNRCGNYAIYNTEVLLDRFEKGERINVDFFNKFISSGCHQEIDLIMRKEYGII